MAEKDFEADDLELKDYAFEPETYTVNDVQITDYTGIEHDKIFLVNKKDILTKPRPSWIPELDENCLEREDFLPHCVKDSDGYYFVQKTSLEVPEDYNGPKLSDYEKRQKFTKKTYYKMSLDLIAATCDYYIKKRKAEIKLSGDTHRVGFPRSAGSMTWARYDDMVSMFSLCEAYKDDPEITKNYGHVKARRSNPKHKGYIRQTEIAFHDHYGPLLQELKDKKLDMNLQKQDAADTHKKGEETSYGMSDRSDTLKKNYGVTIKKQNGTSFDSQQLKNISEALENVWNHYGKLDDVAIAFNLGISYAANTLQHARKAVGIFHPEYHAIGVSFFEEKVADSKDSSMVLCHEVAHWLDFEKGNRDHFHYASDKTGTLENKIALKFKELVRKRNSGEKKLGDYWYRTCECLARAMEEDYGLKHDCYDFYNDQAYLTPEVFKKEILPLVEQLLEENRKYFNLVKKENLSQELSTAKDLSFFDINENTLRKLIKSYTSSAASLAETEKTKPDTFNYLRGANKAMDNKINRYQEKIVKLQTKIDVLNMLVHLETKQPFGPFEMKTLEADICPVDRDDILRMDKNTFEYYAAVINSALKNTGFSEKKSIPLVLKNPSGYTFNTLNILEDGNIEVVSGSVNSLSEDEFKAIKEKNLELLKIIENEIKKQELNIMHDKEIKNNKKTSENKTRWFSVHYKQIAEDRAEFLDHIHKNQEIENLDIHKTLLENHLEIQGCILGGTGIIDSAYESFVCSGVEGFKYLLTPHNSNHYKTENKIIVSDKIFDTFEDAVKACIEEEIKVYKPEITDYKIAEDSGYFFRIPEKYRDFILDYILENKKEIVTEAEVYAAKNNISEISQKEKLRHYIGISMEGYNKYRFDNPEWSKIIDDHVKQIENPLLYQNEKTDPEAAEKKAEKTKYKANDQKYISKFLDKDGITIDFERWTKKDNPTNILGNNYELSLKFPITKNVLDCFARFVIDETEPDGTFIKNHIDFTSEEYINSISSYYNERNEHYPDQDEFDAIRWKYITDGQKLVRLGFIKIRDIDSDITDALIKTGREKFKDELSFYKNSSRQNCRVFKLDDNAGNPLYIIHNFETQQYGVLQDVNPENPGITYFHAEGYPELDGLLLHLGERTNLSAEESKKLKYFECPSLNIKFTPELLLEKKALDYETIDYYKNNSGFEMSFYNKLKEAVSPQKNNDFSIDYSEEKSEPVQQDLFEISENNKEYWITDKDGNRITNSDAKKIIKDNLDLLNHLSEEKTPTANSKMVTSSYISDYLLERLNKEDAQEVKNFTKSFYDNIRNDYLSSLSDDRIAVLLGKSAGSGFSFNESEANFFRKNLEKKLVRNDYFIGTLQTVVKNFSKEWSDTLDKENPQLISLLKKACDESIDYESRLYTAYLSYHYKHDPDDVAGYSLEMFKDKIINDRTLMEKYLSAYPEFEKLYNEYIEHNKISEKANLVSIFKEHNRNIKITEKQLSGRIYNAADTNPEVLAIYYDDVKNEQSGLLLSESMAAIIASHQGEPFATWLENISSDVKKVYPEITDRYIRKAIEPLKLGFGHGRKMHTLILQDHNYDIEQNMTKSNISKETNMTETTKPHSFFIKDTAEFDAFADFEPVTNLTAEQAVKKYAELRKDGYSCGIGMHIPGDFIFDDPDGNGITLVVNHEGTAVFDIYGDTFIDQLQEKDIENGRARLYIDLYKELYNAFESEGVSVKKPQFVFDKESELFIEKEIQNVISTDNIHLNNEHGENGWHSMDMFVADEKYIKAAAISDERFAMPVASWKDGEPEITVSLVTLLISDPENHDKQYLDVSSKGKPSISSDEKWNLIREQKTFDVLGEQIKNLSHKGISFYEWAKKDPEDSRSLEYIICNKDSKAYFDDSQTISNNLMNFLQNSEFVNADYSDDKITVTLNFDDESFELCQNELVKLDIDWGLEHRIHQVITYSRDTLDDDKQAFVSLEEAQAAAKDYLSNDYYKDENGKPYYDGVCVLNNKTKEIEFTQGLFPSKEIFSLDVLDKNNFEQNFINEMNNIDPDSSYYELFRDKLTGKLITEELNQMGFMKDKDGNYVLDDIKVSLSLVFNNKENPALIISHISAPAVMQTIHLNDSYAKKHSLGMAFEDLLESGWLKETKNPNLKSFIDGKMLERDFIGKYIPDADSNEAVTLLDDITAYEEGFSDVLKSFKDFKDAWDISVSSEQEVSDFGGKLQKALYNAAEAIKDKKAYADSLLRYAEKYKPGMEDPDNVYDKFKFHEDELKVFLKVNMINASIYNISMDKNRDGTQIIFALMSSKDKRHYGYITADFDDPANCKYNFTDLKDHNLDISLTENISKMRDFCEKGKPFYEASENHSVNIELTSDGSKLSLTFNEVPDIDLRSSLNWAGFKYSTIAKAWKADFNQENSDKLLATVKKYWPDDYEHAVKQMEGIGTKTAAEHKKESVSVDFSQIENTSEKLAENMKFINEKYPEYKGNLTHILTDIMFNATSKNRNEILDKFRDCNNKDELNRKLKKMVYGSFETEIKNQLNVKPKKDPEESFSR